MGNTPLYVYDYNSFDQPNAPTVLDVVAGAEASFNDAGSVIAVRAINGEVRFYTVP